MGDLGGTVDRSTAAKILAGYVAGTKLRCIGTHLHTGSGAPGLHSSNQSSRGV